MKMSIIIIAVAVTTLSCGESKKERAQRDSAAADRWTVLEYQRQDNIQRQKDRDQQTIDTGAKVLDIITR